MAAPQNPPHPSTGGTRPVTASVTPLTLNRRTGTVTGALGAGPVAVGFEPEFVRTTKGYWWVDDVGAFAYSPLASARRAASRADAAFLGNHNDTLTVTAYDAYGARVRVHATIPILGWP
jgi:hypothetical protein